MILLAYAKFLWHQMQNLEAAKEAALAIYQRQPNHYELNLLLAELAIEHQQYDAARNYLSALNKVENHNLSKRLADLNQQIVSMKK